MPIKSVNVPDIGEVTILRKKGVRSLRLRVDMNGTVRLTMPWWVHSRVGIQFVASKADWIREQQQESGMTIVDGMRFGTNLIVRIKHGAVRRIQTRYSVPFLKVTLPNKEDSAGHAAQTAIERAVFNKLKIQAEETLLPRLQYLADLYDFDFENAYVRKLKARWGSCTSKGEITINAYLVQMPIELSDYVLFHELAHTKHLHHGKEFWACVESVCPDYKERRKRMKQYQPRLYPQ